MKDHSIYPSFEEIIELVHHIDKYSLDDDTSEEGYSIATDILSLLWRILWLSYPDTCYKNLIKIKKTRSDLSSQIDQYINDLRSIVEYDLYYIEFPFDFDHLLSEFEILMDSDITKKITDLFDVYRTFDIHHFQYQMGSLKSINKRLLNDMMLLFNNSDHLGSLNLNSENKISYYLAIIENYARFIANTLQKNRNSMIQKSDTEIEERVIILLGELIKYAKEYEFEIVEFDIDLVLDCVKDFGVKMVSDIEIRTIEIKNLHMESSEVRGSVERVMSTLERHEDQMAEQEYLDSLHNEKKKRE